ncbi:MAG: molecular chaperone [Cenarchaeum symbiont of Oopsacas minuta]|nr:molecular chaperone [Cenarchaeum symbiont of Oopsacas minuta]
MTMFNNRELDKLFNDISDRFLGSESLAEVVKAGHFGEPLYYGYTMTVGSDGKPVIKEYGNVRSNPATTLDNALVDTIVDEKGGQLKLVAEMPGVEKEDIHAVVNGNIVNIEAEHDAKKYNVSVPIEHKVLKDSAKASYKNGILEMVFKLIKKPEGTKVEVN